MNTPKNADRMVSLETNKDLTSRARNIEVAPVEVNKELPYSAIGLRQSKIEGSYEQMDKRIEGSDAYLRYIMRIFISLCIVLIVVIITAGIRFIFTPQQQFYPPQTIIQQPTKTPSIPKGEDS